MPSEPVKLVRPLTNSEPLGGAVRNTMPDSGVSSLFDEGI